jgi:competence/damage-inducible protein CinA-like protein
MPSAQIIAIGTELLLGVTQDTNTAFIARTLNQHGVDIFKTAIIGDNQARIAREIQNALQSADIIITTGGLGPTVDDPTRQAVATAFGVDIEYHPELWEQIIARFRGYNRQPSENNKRQAYLPQGALAIENPVGTAPAFAYEKDGKIVISLPGVPSEMKTLLLDYVLPLLQSRYDLAGITLSRTLHTAGMGESNVDELVADLEALSNPTVGLAAHPGQVDVRITAKAASAELAQRLIQPVEAKVRRLLGIKIYGSDGETLDDVVAELLSQHSLSFDLSIDQGLEEVAGEITNLPIFSSLKFISGRGVPAPALETLYNDKKERNYVSITCPDANQPKVVDVLIHLDGVNYPSQRSFGGHPALIPLGLKNYLLGTLRETIIQTKGDICKK